MATIRLTAAQAMVRWLCAQRVEVDDREVPYFAGAWAIFPQPARAPTTLESLVNVTPEIDDGHARLAQTSSGRHYLTQEVPLLDPTHRYRLTTARWSQSQVLQPWNRVSQLSNRLSRRCRLCLKSRLRSWRRSRARSMC